MRYFYGEKSVHVEHPGGWGMWISKTAAKAMASIPHKKRNAALLSYIAMNREAIKIANVAAEREKRRAYWAHMQRWSAE